ncbi:MAG: hypothetical protein HC851_19020 [Acaryochloris sp. RU_4_1]|nr:hypothetical protein [Acaryochloris sp. RU_4_1]NJR56355.1 hypothetical protein [Acaryochloris sp. CRU_2_0]
MIESSLLVSTAIQGYKWLQVWHERQANPPHLPQHAILAFQRFKDAYDSKNIYKLGVLISSNYRGDMFGVTSKQAYLNTQKRVFNVLPWFINPCLCINVYSIVDDTPEQFCAIIDTQSMGTAMGIPVFTYDSAPVRCRIRKESGLWVISEMFVEERLV